MIVQIDGAEYAPIVNHKPLLADAKIGDLCRLKNGYWTQIKDIASEGGFDYVCENGHSYTVNGVENITSPDIAYWQPLATEGSAEWAWQMLKLGKPVTNKRVFIGGHIKDTCSDKYHFVQMWGYSGWQLYEELEYKVGDYIKDGGDYYIVTSPTTCVGLLNGKGYEICPKTCKIVFPSEVVLDFGSGIKGTVRSCEHDGGCVRVISGDRVIAHIMTDVLEQPTRNLVGQLLKAQEEQ